MTVEESLIAISNMSDKEKENFTRLANMLISQTFLLRDKNNTISPDYLFVENRLEKFEDYFNLIGWSIKQDKRNGVIYAQNESGANHVKLDKPSTLILLAIRLMYDEKRGLSGSTSEVCVTVGEIFNKIINEFSALKNTPTINERKNAFRVLDHHNIITRLDEDYADMDCRIIVHPSILYVLSSEHAKAICDALNKEKENSYEKVE